jgi:integrase
MANKKHRKNGEGTLFQRKDGRWQASFIPENGKRKYIYAKTQAEVLDKLHKAQQEDKQGVLATGPKQAFGEYINQWLEHVHKPTIRVSSYVTYRSLIRNHIIPGLGRIAIQKLTPQRIQAFYSTLQEKGLAPQSISSIHAILLSSLDNAVRWNLVSRNVVSLVSSPHVERHEAKILNTKEAMQLLETVKGNRMYGIILIAVTTGLRRGEILSLHWNDINLQDGTLYVHRTVNRFTGYGFVENDSKTKSSRRKIALPKVVVDALVEHNSMQDHLRQKAGSKWIERNIVFSNATGNYIQPNYVRIRFHELLTRAGLPDMRFHDLRHSAATILLVMGVHPKVVQELLGHSSIAITMNVYSHLLPSMQGDAMNLVNDVFKKEEGRNQEETKKKNEKKEDNT